MAQRRPRLLDLLILLILLVGPFWVEADAQTTCLAVDADCDSKVRALTQLLLMCSAGSHWCTENIWPNWTQHNPSCHAEGQVACVQACKYAGTPTEFCITLCK